MVAQKHRKRRDKKLTSLGGTASGKTSLCKGVNTSEITIEEEKREFAHILFCVCGKSDRDAD